MTVSWSLCCCMSARTGSFVVGYLQLVGEILYVIGLLSYIVSIFTKMSSQNQDDAGHGVGVFLLCVLFVMLLVMTVMLALTIGLLVGLHKEKRGHVRRYLTGHTVLLSIVTVLFIHSLFDDIGTSTVIANVLRILVQTYFLLVVKSHLSKMEDDEAAVNTV